MRCVALCMCQGAPGTIHIRVTATHHSHQPSPTAVLRVDDATDSIESSWILLRPNGREGGVQRPFCLLSYPSIDIRPWELVTYAQLQRRTHWAPRHIYRLAGPAALSQPVGSQRGGACTRPSAHGGGLRGQREGGAGRPGPSQPRPLFLSFFL